MEDYSEERVGPYVVIDYKADSDKLLVIFNGGMFSPEQGPPQQFRSSLQHLYCALVFVMDDPIRIFNHAATPDMFRRLNQIAAGYDRVATLGESVGACGALLFGGLCAKVERVLALSPAYSVADPFIKFDPRFRQFGEFFPLQHHWTFGSAAVRPKAQLLFGTTDWMDAVHAGMFLTERYHVSFVQGADHFVAAHLKQHSAGAVPRLVALFGVFADFDQTFDRAAVITALGPLFSRGFDAETHGFAAYKEKRRDKITARRKPPPPPPDAINLALHRPTDQSSVSQWSRGATTREDSANAVSGVVAATYAFHTGNDGAPWWRVDLGALAVIQELRIYNRTENMNVIDRGIRFAVDLADAPAVPPGQWREVFCKTDGERFGGADGTPFIWRPEFKTVARHLRIRLLVNDYMHYGAIEVYGTPV